MENTHVEIPGYDYDPELNRYFKRTSMLHHISRSTHPKCNSTTTTTTTTTTTKSLHSTRVDRNRQSYNLLTFIRYRKEQLECNDYTDRIIEELIVPKPNIEITKSLNDVIKDNRFRRQYHCTIKDMKIDDSGHYLALLFYYEHTFNMSVIRKEPVILYLNAIGSLLSTETIVDRMQYGITCTQNGNLWSHQFSNFFVEYIDDVKVTSICTSTKYSIRFDESRAEHSIPNRYHSIIQYLNNINTSVVSSDHHGNHRVGDTTGVCVLNEERQTSHGSHKHVFCKNAVTVIEDFRQFSVTCFGYKNGTVVIYKHQDRSHTMITAIKKSIVGLYPYHHDYKIVISAMNSQLESWDINTNKCILKFAHHQNTYRHVSGLIDGRDRILVIVNDTGTINIWSLSNGGLLHSLKPTPLSPCLPIVCHTDLFGGYRGYGALIIAFEENVIVYNIN